MCEAGGQQQGVEAVKFIFRITVWTALYLMTLGCRDNSFVTDKAIQLADGGVVTAQADAQSELSASDGESQQEPECSKVANSTAAASGLTGDAGEKDTDDDHFDDHENESHCESEHDDDHD